MTVHNAPKGTQDIVSDQYYARDYVARTMLRVLEKYGFRQVITPAFETIEVFKAKAGEAIIDQIYDFHDKAGRHLALKSDITASVGRLVAQRIREMPKPVKISSFDRIWRYERPQAGRLREFFQINAEMFGARDAISDAELLSCFCDCYDSVGLTNYRVHIGHRKVLEEFVRSLGVEQKSVLDVIRVVDKAGKIEHEEFQNEVVKAGLPPVALEQLRVFSALKGPLRETIERAKQLFGSISSLQKSLDEVHEAIAFLEAYGIASKCVLDFAIARGSDYYTGVIFECIYDTQLVGSIGGGGRYDDLVEVFGGVATPAVGFSIGFERVMLLLFELGKLDPHTFVPPTEYYVAVVDNSCVEIAIRLAQHFRRQNKSVEVDLLGRKIKDQLAHASRIQARIAVIVGPDELSAGEVVVRDMTSRQERRVALDELLGNEK